MKINSAVFIIKILSKTEIHVFLLFSFRELLLKILTNKEIPTERLINKHANNFYRLFVSYYSSLSTIDSRNKSIYLIRL